MSDQKFEIEISTKATGSGLQQATTDIQKLKAETTSTAPTHDSARAALEDYAQNMGELDEAAKRALTSMQQLKDMFAEFPALFNSLSDSALVNPVENSNPSQINAVALALERAAAASQTAAENTGIIRAHLTAIGTQHPMFNPLDGGARSLDSEVQPGSAPAGQTNSPGPALTGRDLGPSPQVRAAIERAQAETAAVGKAWADAMIQLRAYVDSQAGAISARQQNRP